MSNDYVEKHLLPHARIAILRFLEDAPRYTSNVSMLSTLLPSVGIAMSRSQITDEVRWLEAEELAEVVEAGEGFIIVTATVAGVEVAQGIVSHEGVQRPRPGS